MTGPRIAPFASVTRPWRAAVDTRSPWPARFYAGLIAQTLRYGMPSTRRLGGLWALAGRRGIPERELAAILRRGPRRPRPELDELLGLVASAWPALAERTTRIPPLPPPLTALGIERATALTAFVFGEAPSPLLVLKLPRRSEAAVRRDASALREAGPVRLAPRELGMVGPAFAQEALPGTPLRVEPLTVARIPTLGWPASLGSLAEGIIRLSAATAKRKPADDVGPLIEAVVGEPSLRAATRRAIGAAWRDARTLTTSVLRHRDTSAQNCLFQGDSLTGIVDWEMSTTRGSPGFDVWNAALAWVEHGLGLRRWSEERAVAALASGWGGSGYWAEARAAARLAATAGGVPEQHHDALEALFFAVRVGVRVARPDACRAIGLAASAAMLEVVCAG